MDTQGITLISNILSFLFGIIIGLILPSNKVVLNHYVVNMNFRLFVGLMVTVIWSSAYLLSFITGQGVDAYINFIFSGIVGSVFGEEVFSNIKKQ